MDLNGVLHVRTNTEYRTLRENLSLINGQCCNILLVLSNRV
jgi:hypothetical protein